MGRPSQSYFDQLLLSKFKWLVADALSELSSSSDFRLDWHRISLEEFAKELDVGSSASRWHTRKLVEAVLKPTAETEDASWGFSLPRDSSPEPRSGHRLVTRQPGDSRPPIRRRSTSESMHRAIQVQHEEARIRLAQPNPSVPDASDHDIRARAEQEVLRRDIVTFGTAFGGADLVQQTQPLLWNQVLDRGRSSQRYIGPGWPDPRGARTAASPVPASSTSRTRPSIGPGLGQQRTPSPDPTITVQAAINADEWPVVRGPDEGFQVVTSLHPSDRLVDLSHPNPQRADSNSDQPLASLPSTLHRSGSLRRSRRRLAPRSPYASADFQRQTELIYYNLSQPPASQQELPDPEGPFTDFQGWTSRRRHAARLERRPESSLDVSPRRSLAPSDGIDAEVLGSSSSVAALAERDVIERVMEMDREAEGEPDSRTAD